jgi:hypothetical protein
VSRRSRKTAQPFSPQTATAALMLSIVQGDEEQARIVLARTSRDKLGDIAVTIAKWLLTYLTHSPEDRDKLIADLEQITAEGDSS